MMEHASSQESVSHGKGQSSNLGELIVLKHSYWPKLNSFFMLHPVYYIFLNIV